MERELIGVQDHILQQNRREAVDKLQSYRSENSGQILYPHQVTVLEALGEHFVSGKTEGYINLPTGSGKTVVAMEIIRALDMKTVVLSPTQTILSQTSTTMEQMAPEVDHSNYYSGEKDLSGNVLNTTYQSFIRLLETEEIKPEEIELLICDEVHTALGEERHKLFRAVPHALMVGLTATPHFEQIKGYQKRGIVGKDERWIDLFTRKIHEMTLEEGIEKEILSPLEVHMLKTSVAINDINVESTGEYNKGELERYLNIEIRNGLIVAMLAGAEALPENIRLTAEQREELAKIHGEIRGKRTAIFGLSIAHIEKLAQRLRDTGITADTMHGRKTKTARDNVLAAHASGDIQVILGVDALRIGWDSPPTEVGIYAAPTKSGIVAVQELGRILRRSDEKEKAIAIQMVDEFKSRMQAPVLIPNIFDPYYVLRGTQTGEARRLTTTAARREKPRITFSGADVRLIAEDAYLNQFLQKRFNQASLPELCEVVDNLALRIQTDFPLESAIFQYRKIVDALPGKVSAEIQNQALQAVASIDTNVSEMGARLLTYLNLKTIFSVINPYLTGNTEIDSDLAQEAISYTFNILKNKRLKTTLSIPQQLHVLTKTAVESFMEANIAKPFIDERLQDRHLPLTDEEIDDLSQEAQIETGIAPEMALRYIKYVHAVLSKTPKEEDETVKTVEESALRIAIDEAVDSLSVREKIILKAKYGLDYRHDGTETNEKLGKEFGWTGSWIGALLGKAERHLRHPSRSRRLKVFLKPDGEEGYIQWQREIKKDQGEQSLHIDQLGLSESARNKLQEAFIITVPALCEMRYKRLRSIFISRGDDQGLQEVEDRLGAFLDFNGEEFDRLLREEKKRKRDDFFRRGPI